MIKRTKFNVSLLGDSRVGKTCIVNSLKGIPFDEHQIATIGVDDVIDEAKFDGKTYKFKIFDTAGQERYKSISTNTIQIADGFLLVFSVCNRESFERISYWINTIEDKVNIKEKVIILIGNQIDKDNRVVTHEEADEFSKSHMMKYFETSAKTGFNIKESFNQLYEDIYNLNKKLGKNENIEIMMEKNSNDKNNDIDKKKKNKWC